MKTYNELLNLDAYEEITEQEAAQLEENENITAWEYENNFENKFGVVFDRVMHITISLENEEDTFKTLVIK